jgi:calcium-binding protein CML
MGANALSED